MKKLNDITLKFKKKYIFCKIALQFFFFSAYHIDISMIEGAWEREIIEQLSLKFKSGCLSQYYL